MFKYILMVFAGACSFGILSTFVKLAYRQGYTAADITFSQALISMLVLWLLVLAQQKKVRVSAKDLSFLLFTGAAIGITTFVYYISVHYISASLAIVVLMQFTWLSALLDWLLFKKPASRTQIIIMLVIIAASILAGGLTSLHASLKGVLIALGAALLYAIYVVANSRTVRNISPLYKSAVIMTGSALGILLVNANSISHFDFPLLKWALFFALFGTIIPQVLFARGIPKIGAGISAVIMTAELPVAVITVHIVLHEHVSFMQWIGIIVMLMAIVIMHLKK
jgi:drug/metabolite transporter (DMT)-like permease